MKYKITIEQIVEKEVVKSVYYPEEENKGGTKGAYADTKIKEEVSEYIYGQTITCESLDLMAVIKAFNEKNI